MLLWILGLLLVLAPSAVFAGFVVVEVVPEVVGALVDGDELVALLLAPAIVAMAVIAVTPVVAVLGALLTRDVELRRRLVESQLATALWRWHLRLEAVSCSEPVVGVKLANVHWQDADAPPEFSGAGGGNPYGGDDIARCGNGVVDRLCVSQHRDHRCGFYALPTGNALLAELTGLAEAQAVEAYDWRDVLEPFDDTTHVVTVALHGEVVTYDAAMRGQRQTVTAIDLPATCARQRCDAPVEVVAAVGYPLGLCGRHGASRELACRTLPLAEFAQRFGMELRPTSPTGRPAPHCHGHRRHAREAAPAVDQELPAAMPVEHRDERVEGWLAGSFDLELGQLVTDSHRPEAETHAHEPVTAARETPVPASRQALARVRLGGEVVVRRTSLSSRHVEVWDVYLPERCQHSGCRRASQLVDRDGSLAVTRCRPHASETARPATQLGAEHGMAIRLAA